MELNLKKIGEFITPVDKRNIDGSISNLIGVSISKDFISSVANIVGTDLTKYKIIEKGQFACSLMQVSRDGGIAISLYKNDEPAIMSPAYYIFEVDKDKIKPEYFELITRSKEFDRLAVFLAIGGVRGTLSWSDFCDMKIDVPKIEKQKETIKRFNVINERMKLLKNINSEYIEIIQLIMNKYVFNKLDIYDLSTVAFDKMPSNWSVMKLSDVSDCQSGYAFYKDGYTNKGTRILDLGNININGELIRFLDDKRVNPEDYSHRKYDKFRLQKNDLVMVMTDRKSTMDLLGRTAKVLDDENMFLNQRVYRIRPNINVNYLYAYLNNEAVRFYYMSNASGTAQKYLNNGDIDNIPIIIPDEETINIINSNLDRIMRGFERNIKEIDKLQDLIDIYREIV